AGLGARSAPVSALAATSLRLGGLALVGSLAFCLRGGWGVVGGGFGGVAAGALLAVPTVLAAPAAAAAPPRPGPRPGGPQGRRVAFRSCRTWSPVGPGFRAWGYFPEAWRPGPCWVLGLLPPGWLGSRRWWVRGRCRRSPSCGPHRPCGGRRRCGLAAAGAPAW